MDDPDVLNEKAVDGNEKQLLEHTTVQGHHLKAWNDMLRGSIRDVNLEDRFDDIEHRFGSFQKEFMDLRATTDEILRRLTALETKSVNNNYRKVDDISAVQQKLVPKYPYAKPGRHPVKVISQSLHNLRTDTMGPSESNKSSALNNGNAIVERSRIKLQNGTPSKLPVRRYMRRTYTSSTMPKSSIKKWTSNVDMQGASVTNSRIRQCANSALSNQQRSNSQRKFSSTHSLLYLSQGSLSHSKQKKCYPLYLPELRQLQVCVNNKSVLIAVPNAVRDSDLLEEVSAPNTEPSLEWVYGYRGKDARGNLYELPTGEVVYFVGTIVVLHNFAEGKQRYYTAHTSDVKCMAVHPNKLHVATGQTARKPLENEPLSSPSASLDLSRSIEAQRYKAHVRIWDPVTLQTTHVLCLDSGFEFVRSIACLAFSKASNGDLLAVIDDSKEHVLSLWDWRKRSKLAEAKNTNEQVFACAFHPRISKLISYGKGHCYIWSINSTALSKMPLTFEGRNKPKMVLSACFTTYGLVVLGDSNGSLSLWEPQMMKMRKLVPKAHEEGVWALQLLDNGHVVSAGRDCSLIIWETTNLTKVTGPLKVSVNNYCHIRTLAVSSQGCLLVGCTDSTIFHGSFEVGFRCVHQGHAVEISALIAHPSHPYFLSAGSDCTIRLWNSVTKNIIWTFSAEDKIECVSYHPSGQKFAVGFHRGNWIIFDVTSREKIYSKTEGSEPITALKFSPSGKYLAIASKATTSNIMGVAVHIYSTLIGSSGAEVLQSISVTGTITTMDWSTNDKLLRANDSDLQHYIWNVSSGNLATEEEVRSATWQTRSCLTSFENAYITHNSNDKVAVEGSQDSTYVIAAIKSGTLQLYTHPAISCRAAFKELPSFAISTAHVAFLPSKFVYDGDKDGTIYQWRL